VIGSKVDHLLHTHDEVLSVYVRFSYTVLLLCANSDASNVIVGILHEDKKEEEEEEEEEGKDTPVSGDSSDHAEYVDENRYSEYRRKRERDKSGRKDDGGGSSAGGGGEGGEGEGRENSALKAGLKRLEEMYDQYYDVLRKGQLAILLKMYDKNHEKTDNERDKIEITADSDDEDIPSDFNLQKFQMMQDHMWQKDIYKVLQDDIDRELKQNNSVDFDVIIDQIQMIIDNYNQSMPTRYDGKTHYIYSHEFDGFFK